MPKITTMTHKVAKKRAWTAFSIYIRTRDAERDRPLLDGDQAFCISCDKPYPVFGVGCLQAGHFIPGRNGKVLFDEQQVYAQCYNCNIRLKGNWPKFYLKMVALFGEPAVEHMIATHHEVVKISVPEFLEIEAKYKELTAAL